MPAASAPEGRTDCPDLVVIGAGAIAFVQGVISATTGLALGGALVCATGFAGSRKHGWARWLYLAVGLGIGILAAARVMAHDALTSRAAIEFLCAATLLSVAGFKFWRGHRGDETDEPMLSLVLLERGARSLDPSILAYVIDGAWNTQLGAGADESQEFVAGEEPTFIVKTSFGQFVIHSFAQPYWEDCDEVLAHLNDVRAQRAVDEHDSWISVDYLGTARGKERLEVYRRIGNLLAELAGTSTLAVFHPETGSFRVWDEDVSEDLRGSSPLECFASGKTAPVVQVSPDDPVMEAAVAEARRRWTEFTTAFSKRHPEQHFSVKAPVTRMGHTEHIWIEVTSIQRDEIRGRLGNDPVDLGELKLGDPISVSTDSVEDWLYVLTDEPIGGFTIPAVTSAPRRSRRSV